MTSLPTYVIENHKAEWMDRLYAMDGRHDPAHPMHGVYTGLWQQRGRQLAEAEREEAAWLDQI